MSLAITLLLLSSVSSLSPDLAITLDINLQDDEQADGASELHKLNTHFQLTEQNNRNVQSLLGIEHTHIPEGARTLQSLTQICKLYDDNGVCLYCFRDQYMVNSVCVDVPDEKLISRCNIYSSDFTCFECDSGFVLSSDKKACNSGNASLNCDKFKDQTTCETCKTGSYLSGSVCIAIQNCAQTSGSSCTVCQSGYYLENNICTSVANTELIPNCSNYGTDKKCLACADGYTLNGFRTACLTKEQVKNQVDPNCLRSFVNEGGFCSACVEGYYLKNGVCTKCIQDDKCLICNPIQPSECLLCRPSYHMASNTSGVCALNNDLATQTESRDPLEGSSTNRPNIFATLLIIIGVFSSL